MPFTCGIQQWVLFLVFWFSLNTIWIFVRDEKILPGILTRFFKYVSLIKTLKSLEMEPMAPEKQNAPLCFFLKIVV